MTKSAPYVLALAAALGLTACSPATGSSAPPSTSTPPPSARTVTVAGYVIVAADYIGTAQAQNQQGGTVCVNATKLEVKQGAQVVIKDANGTSIDVITLGKGVAQWPPGHTDKSPANELGCVYPVRMSSLKVPTAMLSFELAGAPALAVKAEGESTLRPQILVGNPKGEWSTYRMQGD